MDITTLPVGSYATNCYILTEAGKCLVIDPGFEVQAILGELSRLAGQKAGSGKGSEPKSGGPDNAAGLPVQAILITHAHPDHTGAAGALQEVTNAPVYVGERDAFMLTDPGWSGGFPTKGKKPIADLRYLHEGDEVRLGDTVLHVWETPGHSPGSVSFVAGAPGPGGSGRADAGQSAGTVVFSGDVLFLEGVGRTDFPGCDAGHLARSLDRFLDLQDDTRVFPGHGDPTTVGHERENNPFL